jgi:hypothetical protein
MVRNRDGLLRASGKSGRQVLRLEPSIEEAAEETEID